MGFSLWLVPAESQSSSLTRIMHAHPPSARSPSSYPHFHPHITLTTVPSETPLSTLLAAIPPNQKALDAKFQELKVGDVYFRSLYIAIRPTSDLSLLHKKIHENLRIKDPKSPAYPHMSIYYIDDSEPEERARVAHELLANGTIVEASDTGDNGDIIIDCSKGPNGVEAVPPSMARISSDLLHGFDGTEIWAAMCDGPVETWTIRAKVKLL